MGLLKYFLKRLTFAVNSIAGLQPGRFLKLMARIDLAKKFPRNQLKEFLLSKCGMNSRNADAVEIKFRGVARSAPLFFIINVECKCNFSCGNKSQIV